MAPKKKEQQKMSLGDFMADPGSCHSAIVIELTADILWQALEEARGPMRSKRPMPLPPTDRPRPSGLSSYQDRGFSTRESFPQRIPDKPPYTAHLGNLSYDATIDSVTDFFEGCDVASVRIIEDRELQRPKGFGYVEFTNVDGLKKALDLDGQSFQGRLIKIKIADPPRGGEGRTESARDLTDWTRKGPLPDLPTRGGRQPSDFGDRRPREFGTDRGPARELTWERRGPLSPLPQSEMPPPRSRDGSRPRPSPEGLGERSESFRGNRQGPGASWGEGRQDGSRPPARRDAPMERERVSSAAEKDMQWRDRMRPDVVAKSTSPSRDGSEAPPSPSMPPAPAAPVGRPRLNLQKRTVSEATDAAAAAVTPVSASDSKASPFGAARPIDTATKEKEIEERRQQVLREKREAEEKAKEERRLAKQAAEEQAAKEAEEKAAKEAQEAKEEKPAAATTSATSATSAQNGTTAEPKVPLRSREPVANVRSKAAEAGSWRSAPNEQRLNRGPPGGGPRGGRGGAAPRGGSRGGGGEGRGGRANGSSSSSLSPTTAAGQTASTPTTTTTTTTTTTPTSKTAALLPSQQHQQQSSPASGPTGTPEAETPTTLDDEGWTMVPGKKGRQSRVVAS
ncbi:hypothetical protein L249_5268 [Ophiocordyceps polyrhachis-furcata BCC 54312]|uniref:RRM domain-containing protein n=1 Tax=Ophiocordyceps polyrhachis-furcata BCC 54312 TaxID=1330021 RepID=A0A367L8T4_9HYPO|nr:hypothetical protein L249_5268 [Ophiocordyceps polyrhachis-furcata BCC 54312]